MTHWDGPSIEAWDAWTPEQIAKRLAGVDAAWCVIGGWAVDLFLGEETRPHDDLEIAIPAADLWAVRRALDGYVFHAVGDGEVCELPADAETPPEKHQNWVLDRDAGAWRVDVMLEPGDASTWVYRKDQSIRTPRSFMVSETPQRHPVPRAAGRAPPQRAALATQGRG